MRELLIGSLSTLFLSSACLVTVWLCVFLDCSHFGVCGVCFNCGFTHHWNCEEGKDVSSFFVMKPIWHKEEGLILLDIVSFWSPGLCPSYDVLLVGLGQKVLALSLVARAFYSRSAFFFPEVTLWSFLWLCITKHTTWVFKSIMIWLMWHGMGSSGLDNLTLFLTPLLFSCPYWVW